MIDNIPEFLLLALALVAIVIAFILSMAEGALSRITRAGVAEIRQEGKRNAESVERLVDSRQRSVTAVAFFRLLCEMTAAVLITLIIADWLPQWWQVMIVAVIVTALVSTLVVGASPRELGRRNPERILGVLSGPVHILTVLGAPLAALSERLSLSARTDEEREEDAAESLKDMVDLVSESDEIEDDEREMLQSVFELSDTLTREVMVPRTQMITTSTDTPLDKAVALFVRSGFSRVPVIGDDIDDMRGVLYLKDALRAQRRHPDGELSAAEAMRPVRFVPETKHVDELLREMQAESSHIAAAVDEYGGIAGIVTIEDILEELVGELVDEHDADLPEVEDLGDGRFRVPARMPVDEVGELMELEIDDDDVDSIGGLLAKALGKVPIEGAIGESDGVRMAADRFEGRRHHLATVIVERVPEPDDEEEAS
ncbi:Hemolysin, contains CBS domains [Ruaniaceae bacterium KH17]|nr:Hemolysin, contains CBS domains [Ruaniaceae bacterium KH17]